MEQPYMCCLSPINMLLASSYIYKTWKDFVVGVAKEKHSRKEKDDEQMSDIDVPGRIVLDLWRVIKSEVGSNTVYLHQHFFCLS